MRQMRKTIEKNGKREKDFENKFVKNTICRLQAFGGRFRWPKDEH